MRLDVAEIVKQADDAGLSDRWQRSGLRNAALALEVPLRDYARTEDAVAWFSTGLDEVKAKNVLKTFLDRLAVKTRATRTALTETEPPL